MDMPVPRGAITVNMAPADVRKEGSAYDLPLALGLQAAGPLASHMVLEELEQYWVMGELSLDGAVRPIRGILPMVLQARAEGKRGVLLPAQNAAEAAVVKGIAVYPVHHLKEAVQFFTAESGRWK